MEFVNLFIGFNGRINRARFWLVAICCFVFQVAVMGMTALFTSSMTTIVRAGIVAGTPVAYAVAVSAIKRLHDRNKSGWWVLWFYGGPWVMPLAAAVVDRSAQQSMPILVLQFTSLGILIWAFIELGCLRGTIGQNPYGPDPLAPGVLTPPVRTHA